MPSISFFLLSPHSRLAVFNACVVADIALGYSSNSCRLLHSAKTYDYVQISLYAYLIAAYIPIAEARGITPLFDNFMSVRLLRVTANFKRLYNELCKKKKYRRLVK